MKTLVSKNLDMSQSLKQTEPNNIIDNLHAEDQVHLHTLLTKAIYDNRLYTDKQLESLFSQARVQNSFDV